jgi:hypothetical protein
LILLLGQFNQDNPYKGTIDNQTYSIDFDEGSIIATVESSSPMGSLGNINPFYTSKDNMDQKSLADTAFDQIYEGSAGITLLWGKKQ